MPLLGCHRTKRQIDNPPLSSMDDTLSSDAAVREREYQYTALVARVA